MRKGLSLKIALKKAGVKRYTSCRNLSANGLRQVESLSFTSKGKQKTIASEHVMVHFGVIPNINMIQPLGIKIYWDDSQQCHRPRLNESFKSNRKNTYVIGDAIGIFGVKSAQINGEIAACDITGNQNKKEKLLLESKKDAHIRPFLEQLFRVPKVIDLKLTSETIICKCESITLSEIENAIKAGAYSLNEIKSHTRCGMGPCQGRQCGNMVTMILASMNKTPSKSNQYYNIRTPYVPITFDEMSKNKK